MSDRPTDILRTHCQTDWDAATRHAFCDALADGTLPLAKMRWYLAQDYLFVGGFVRLLASAIAHAPTLADSVPAAQFLAVVTGPENTYFQRAFVALDMSEADINVAPAPATKAFQELMHAAAASGKYQEMLAVLVVAEWSYLSWATPVNPPRDDLPFWFAEWITLHAGAGFEGVVSYLRDQLDAIWPTLDDAEQDSVRQVFSTAVALERQFFDAAFLDR